MAESLPTTRDSDRLSSRADEPFAVEPLRSDHAGELAELHERTFPGYFLTLMGRRFLRRFYREFCRHSFDYGVVVRCARTGQLAAFVVGTSDAPAHFRSLYRRGAIPIGATVAVRCLMNADLRREVRRRAGHVASVVRLLGPGSRGLTSKSVTGKGPPTQCPVRLLGIGAAPEFQGSGAARIAAERFESMLRDAGHEHVGLSTLPNNQRAVAYFRKTGWAETYSSPDEGYWFEKDL